MWNNAFSTKGKGDCPFQQKSHKVSAPNLNGKSQWRQYFWRVKLYVLCCLILIVASRLTYTYWTAGQSWSIQDHILVGVLFVYLLVCFPFVWTVSIQSHMWRSIIGSGFYLPCHIAGCLSLLEMKNKTARRSTSNFNFPVLSEIILVDYQVTILNLSCTTSGIRTCWRNSFISKWECFLRHTLVNIKIIWRSNAEFFFSMNYSCGVKTVLLMHY